MNKCVDPSALWERENTKVANKGKCIQTRLKPVRLYQSPNNLIYVDNGLWITAPHRPRGKWIMI
ncbi:MAG: hypothetical protein K0Q74_1598 [Gammaproteobacteria bacterium]|nr:hypothetical protein [Gammaproteobacteria bacterium]